VGVSVDAVLSAEQHTWPLLREPNRGRKRLFWVLILSSTNSGNEGHRTGEHVECTAPFMCVGRFINSCCWTTSKNTTQNGVGRCICETPNVEAVLTVARGLPLVFFRATRQVGRAEELICRRLPAQIPMLGEREPCRYELVDERINKEINWPHAGSSRDDAASGLDRKRRKFAANGN